jgi:hypothetical protein
MVTHRIEEGRTETHRKRAREAYGVESPATEEIRRNLTKE